MGDFIQKNIPGFIGLALLISVAGFFIVTRGPWFQPPGDYEVKTGNYKLEDGLVEEALENFKAAMDVKPDHAGAHLGMGVTLMQLGRHEESMEYFNKLIELTPDNAVAWADRGILYDKMGRYEEALADYKKALTLDPKVLEGPGWLWRFMRNIHEKPPTIVERAYYIQEELKKPPEERLLKVPEMDEQQRMYKK